MIANMLDILINRMPRWEQASAISTILLITLLIFAAYRRLDRKARHEAACGPALERRLVAASASAWCSWPCRS